MLNRIGVFLILLGELIAGYRKVKVSVSDPVYIYALRYVNRKTVAYVGKTRQHPEKRLERHFNQARNNRHSNKRLAEFLMNGYVTYDILEICSVKSYAQSEEKWIGYFDKKQNVQLLNIRRPTNPFANLS